MERLKHAIKLLMWHILCIKRFVCTKNWHIAPQMHFFFFVSPSYSPFLYPLISMKRLALYNIDKISDLIECTCNNSVNICSCFFSQVGVLISFTLRYTWVAHINSLAFVYDVHSLCVVVLLNQYFQLYNLSDNQYRCPSKQQKHCRFILFKMLVHQARIRTF